MGALEPVVRLNPKVSLDGTPSSTHTFRQNYQSGSFLRYLDITTVVNMVYYLVNGNRIKTGR